MLIQSVNYHICSKLVQYCIFKVYATTLASLGFNMELFASLHWGKFNCVHCVDYKNFSGEIEENYKQFRGNDEMHLNCQCLVRIWGRMASDVWCSDGNFSWVLVYCAQYSWLFSCFLFPSDTQLLLILLLPSPSWSSYCCLLNVSYYCHQCKHDHHHHYRHHHPFVS